jgi:hypothetical protein
MDIQLYINDNLLDQAVDTEIALTFQINNLADVKNQQGNTSNQFKVPLTSRNKMILGFPEDIQFTDNKPYTKYAAKFIQDGIEIIPNGIAELNNIEDGFANLTVLSGNVDFFNAIDGNIYDMGDSTTIWGAQKPWATYDHIWNLQNVVTSQNKTDGWIWPVVDYGKIPDTEVEPQIIDVRDMRPGFFIKTALEIIAKTAGYRIDPDSFLLKDPLYPLLICQFSLDSLDHRTDVQNKPDTKGISVAMSNNVTVNHPDATHPDGVFIWPLINSDPSGLFLGNSTYLATTITSVTATLTIPVFYFQGWATGSHPSTVKISIVLNDPVGPTQVVLASTVFDFTLNWNRISGSGSGVYAWLSYNNTIVTASTDMAAGQSLQVIYEFGGDSGSTFTMYAGSTFVIKTSAIKVQFGEMVECERIFPDISQKDLLKDTLQRFGIVCQTDSNNATITFSSFREIVNNIPYAKDWTNKCLNQGKSVYFQLGNYGQVNYMRYKNDDNVLPKYFADSQININDATLQTTVDLFESQFAGSLNRPYIGGSIAVIQKVDVTSGNTEYSLSTEPRILINQTTNLQRAGRSITFTDGTNNIVYNDNISTPYFYKPGGQYSLLWDDLRFKYYPEIEKILTQSKKLVRWFNLSARDILELNLLIPVYLQQDGAYFYINKIDSWKRGQPVKVELVRL